MYIKVGGIDPSHRAPYQVFINIIHPLCTVPGLMNHMYPFCNSKPITVTDFTVPKYALANVSAFVSVAQAHYCFKKTPRALHGCPASFKE
jgi:hypothetical protein